MPWLEDLKFPRGYQMGTHKSYLLTKHSYEKACKAELIKTINFSINHFKEKIHTKDEPNNRNNS